MYRFVKDGSTSGRLFVQATLEKDSAHPVLINKTTKVNHQVGPPITTPINEKSYERYSLFGNRNDDGAKVHEADSNKWNAKTKPTGLTSILKKANDKNNEVKSLQAIQTNKRLFTEVLGRSTETTKISRKAPSGARRITTSIVRKVTTVTRGEEDSVVEDLVKQGRNKRVDDKGSVVLDAKTKAIEPKRVKISDIVVGQEDNLTAREALLRWARKSTSRYPGVRVADFTTSWRDGLAFSAIIHRNRPDLVSWQEIRQFHVRERLETAFHVVEKEYGVTRLLDAEDVDTHEPDEKSLITYISSLYDVFPDPPAMHPLFDMESQKKSSEYREMATSLLIWIKEKTSYMQDRSFASTLIELKKLLNECSRFKSDEVPPRHRDKQRLATTFRELQKYFEAVGEVDIEPELQPDGLERAWHRLMLAHQDRQTALDDEVQRLERLQRLAEKVHREIKQTDNHLSDLEVRIEEEARRFDRLHPNDGKTVVDGIDAEVRNLENILVGMDGDCRQLKEGRYTQANDLHKRVIKLHQRWTNLRSIFISKLVNRLSGLSYPVHTTVTKQTRTVTESRKVDNSPLFKELQDHIDWCRGKLKKILDSDYGSDLPSVKTELDRHQIEHRTIDQYHSNVAQAERIRAQFTGEDLTMYSQKLSQLQKVYAELLSTSNKRLSDLDALQDFLIAATAELSWLNDREQTELTRDWADKNIDLTAVGRYYENLMSELEKREIQFSGVLDKGEALIVQGHPAVKCIEAHLQALQGQLAWLLQLTLCLEVHLKHSTEYHNFYKDLKEAEQWITTRDEILNTTYSQSDFTLDQGEALLKGMQTLREDLNMFSEQMQVLCERAGTIVPLKQRRLPVNRPLQVQAICPYHMNDISINKGDTCTLYDNSGRVKWRVKSPQGQEGLVPGAVLLIAPPDKEALEAAERLRRLFDRTVNLWQRKQLRLRQNMIFATIKVVKGWDLDQFLAMGADQRTAIRKALNEDANKLLSEGDPADPQLRRLRREMDEVNRLFDEFEKRARAEEESKQAGRIFTEQCTALHSNLLGVQRELHSLSSQPLPRDLDSLEHCIMLLEDINRHLKGLEPDLHALQSTFRSIALKTPVMKKSLDQVQDLWKEIQVEAEVLAEKYKSVEGVMVGIDDNEQNISDLEVKLSRHTTMPSTLEGLQKVHKELTGLQDAISTQQINMDRLNDDMDTCTRLVERSRTSKGPHQDVDRLNQRVEKLNNRWSNVCGQLVDRLQSCEAAHGLLQNLSGALEMEEDWLDGQVIPRDDVDTAKVMLHSAIERVPKIDLANQNGARFIKEAKIYESRAMRFLEYLTELQPSLTSPLARGQQPSSPADGPLARRLDELNVRFEHHLSVLRDMVLNSGDAEYSRFAEAAQAHPRSYRVEFNLPGPDADAIFSSSYSTESKYLRTSTTTTHIISTDAPDHSTRLNISSREVSPSKKVSKTDITTDIHSATRDQTNLRDGQVRMQSPYQSSVHFSEIRSLKRVHKVNESIGTDSVIESKGIVDPKTGRVITVGEAISSRILDVRTGEILVDGNRVPLQKAVKNGLIEQSLADKLLQPIGVDENGDQVSLLQAIQYELYDAENSGVNSGDKIKQAVEEKFRLCEDTLGQLLKWISGVELRLAKVGGIKELPEEMRNQVNTFKQIKDELDSNTRPVSSCLDSVRQLVLTAGDVLSAAEVSGLETSGRELRTRVDRAVERNSKLLRKITSARDELGKLRSELDTFSSWLSGARRELEDRERALSDLTRLSHQADPTRDFVSDVIAHQADLRFITMSGQKFVDVTKEYLSVLNEFRTSLPDRLPHIEPVTGTESPVRQEISLVTVQYRDLLHRSNALSDRLSGLGGRQREHQDALDKARAWLKDAAVRCNKIISEPIAAEPNAVQDQLDRAKALNNEFISQGRLIDTAQHSLQSLLQSLEGQLSPSEVVNLETPVQDLLDRYGQLSEALGDRVRELDKALVQSQGVQDAVDGLVSWLNQAENHHKSQQRPASLIKERLAEQIREHRASQIDLDSHRSSLESVTLSARDLVSSASNARLAKKIESKLGDVVSRFEKLNEKFTKRGEFLEQTSQSLNMVSTSAGSLEAFLHDVSEALDSRELSRMTGEDHAGKVELVHKRLTGRKGEFDECVRSGKNLIAQRDVTDTVPLRDRIKALETQWRDISSSLDEKQKLSKQRSEQLHQYESLRDQVIIWLTAMESRTSALSPVAVDLEVIKNQSEELKPILKEYRDYATTIDKVNDQGSLYDSMVRGDRPESPLRKRSPAYSPIKRTGASPLRRMSGDARSPSPTTKGFSTISPLSPQGSSGFSSRRSSQDGFHLDDLSPVQQQLSEINNRYGLLGVRLTDRSSDLDSTRDELRKVQDNVRILNTFLDKVQRQVPRESVGSKDEAERCTKVSRQVLEEMYEKQSLLDSTKAQVKELIRRKPECIGSDHVKSEMDTVADRWKLLHDLCKDRISFSEQLRDFLDTNDSLSNWLTSKDKMLTVLGPISSDPRMVQSQVQQVQVLRDEFKSQKPQLEHLQSVGGVVVEHLHAQHDPQVKNISNKLQTVEHKWTDLLGRLEERAESLGAAADSSREFDTGLNRLRDALQAISDSLDDLPTDKEPQETLRKVENLERQLEGQRPLLADAEARGAQLCAVLGDPATRADVAGRVGAVGKQYQTLQKKLDNRKAETEAALRDGKQFAASCARTLGWLGEELSGLSDRLLVSAHKPTLSHQLESIEPLHRDVMTREHEVIMLLNKGREMSGKPGVDRSLQRDLEKISQQWDKLKRDVTDRHSRLQTCMELYRKHQTALEPFSAWLKSAEDRVQELRPQALRKGQIDEQLKELQTIRNDVWKKSGEFENCRTSGEAFLSGCDVDKDGPKQDMLELKQRWEKLNNDLLERTQSLEACSKRLGEFQDGLRDLSHAVGRCEDKLSAHDSLGAASRDPKLLERVKALRAEAQALNKPLQALRKLAEDVVEEARTAGADANHLKAEVEAIAERIEDLQRRLVDRCSELQSANTAYTQFNEQVKVLSLDLTGLENAIELLTPPAREIPVVEKQIHQVSGIIVRIDQAVDRVHDVEQSGENLVDSGFAPDSTQTRDQITGLRKQLGRLEGRAKEHEGALQGAMQGLEAFYDAHDGVNKGIQTASDHLRKMKPVGSELEQIRAQQADFNRFKTSSIEPLSARVSDVNRAGQDLVRTAQGGVNTAVLEKDLEKMNEKWNDLKDRLNERDRRLDVGLLQSGKFQEALDGLARWLTDTEEMVANQKPPSADYQVVKAQLQEQKFLKKMLMDRQNSMSSLCGLGKEVGAGCDPQERARIEKQLHELMGRFDNLTDKAQQRTLDLEQAMHVAKQFQEKLNPLVRWLDNTEKMIKNMELIPTDEEKIQDRIREHDALHDDIISKRPDFSELAEIAGQLMGLVGEDEAGMLADRLQNVADRYGHLVENSEALGELLAESRQGLRHLVLTYQELVGWMESMESRLSRCKVTPVHTDKLLEQMDVLVNLTEEIATRQPQIDSTVDSGLELMKHISGDEALQLKDKLDSLQRRYSDLTGRGADLLKHAQEALPIVEQFHHAHNRLVDWMQGAEGSLSGGGDLRESVVTRLEHDLHEMRPILESVNQYGPQLCQLSPGEGAATVEGLITRDNRRFEAIVEQIQRRAERLHLSKQREAEVLGDMDELLEWFREVEATLRDAEPPSCDPDVIRVQLKEQRGLNDDISSQKGRVRDVLSAAKKVLRESQAQSDTSMLRDKLEDLRETTETVTGLSLTRLSVLEQALPLAEHFTDTHVGLSSWLDDLEHQINILAMPALRPDQIANQQDKNEMLVQSITEHKPLVDKLNKTGEALLNLVNEDDGAKVQDIMDADNSRYAALRQELRQRQQALEQALQESSQFSDKLEGMLRALANTADQANSADPISAHPPKIEDQIDENNALAGDLDARGEAYAAVKKAASEVISKAPNQHDPAVRDIKSKLDKLNKLWNDVQKQTNTRGRDLGAALNVAEQFWRELQGVMGTLGELREALASQEPPAAQPQAIQQQQVALQEIRQEIDQTKPEVEQVRQVGNNLMNLCGEPDKPEVKKNLEDLDSAWDNITALYARREENLIDAMEKAMEFHETLQNLLAFLTAAEERFANLGPLGSDIDSVKKQIKQLKAFKDDVDPHMVKVEALNRQAVELTERTSSEQAAAIREPLTGVNRRWEALLRGMVERQRQLEHALLHLGQFQHALSELLVWIQKTDTTLDQLKPVAGDPQVLEVELAKLKVLCNDIQAHQNSVDTLNDAGRQLIESGKDLDEASTTQEKLTTLNRQWRELLQKASDRQHELEEALREAQRFAAEIQDLLGWLGDVDSLLGASRPVGGLPETATEQLERFMEIYNELEENRPKVETLLKQGQEYLKKQVNPAGSNLQHTLRSLKQRWDAVTARASDKRIKLEIALKEATEFHDSLQAFVDWLTNAEKILSGAKPVSRVMDTILGQIEEHKVFQKDVSVHREAMLLLDKRGTHLKYFSQKQDVILIKNLLVSVQHRWERVVAKSAERTRALDHGYKEAKEFHESWSSLMNWLQETEESLDSLVEEITTPGNDPLKIKQRLSKHRETQKLLSSKQAQYDTTCRTGKALLERAPKTDEHKLNSMLSSLKESWARVCSKSVDRQRKLEEALLFSGQFSEALAALLDWLRKAANRLKEQGPVHGDLDTVTALVEQHKSLQNDLKSRSAQLKHVVQTGRDLQKTTADPETGKHLQELETLWDSVNMLSDRKSERLQEALKEAEKLHKSVNVLLEWLSDAETKLRFASQIPEDEVQAQAQLQEHMSFLRELKEKEVDKDYTLRLAHSILEKAHPDAISVIKHWITIIQSRWDEVSQWALQRERKLVDNLQSLKDLDDSLEELLQWLAGLESTLLALEAETLPEEIPLVEELINDHKEFMENTARRQPEVDRACKPKTLPKDHRKMSKTKTSTPVRGSRDNLRDTSPDRSGSLARKQSFKGSRDQGLNSRKSSRASPGRDSTPDRLPHYGPRFPPPGSKSSETELRSPRARLLWDSWRRVWLMAWERQCRLHDRLTYLQDMERVRNFSWDDWRKRFLKFMNHKKSRLTDLFRKMDKDNNGLIPREDFIDGIMKTKFDTSRLEMNAVADLFDRNNSGLIDWQEFINALRPDWQERRPEELADKIHDEVKRLVMLCTCRQKFRVFQVGEGKYRFGDSQKLRLVRILRSTVMVRVGGGWVALDEFLVKNDPCRAKGRTNIELREQFILADGVSQSMAAFKPRAHSAQGGSFGSSQGSLGSAVSNFRQGGTPTAGPITKVRERSQRSIAMGRPATRTSLSAGTPDSLSDNEGSFSASVSAGRYTPRKTSAGTNARTVLTPGGSRGGSKPNSRPASRAGSKPPSRHGSSLSLDSTDDGTPSRIPTRRLGSTSSATGTTPRPTRLAVGSNGTGSRPRTPSGGTSPLSTRRNLSGTTTPILKKGETTPSGLSRKNSITEATRAAGGVATPTTTTTKRRPTPTDQRAPFRL